MTPYTHHMNDAYLNAYSQELTHDLRTARATVGGHRSLRRTVARQVVRFGAWLLPDTPELVDGRILVLEVKAASGPDVLNKAA